MTDVKKIGFIVNPVAGLGGKIGLKGSDSADIVEQAMALGGAFEAPRRSGLALEALKGCRESFEFFTYAADMGETELRERGFGATVVGKPVSKRTTAQDTVDAAFCIKEAAVDIILFAGGDGTASLVCDVIGYDIPVIGIPAGVKNYSAVFAVNPRKAGLMLKDFVEGRERKLVESEVLDIDEDYYRQGIIKTRFCGYMLVPDAENMVQDMKTGGDSDALDLPGIAKFMVDKMEAGTLYIFGPGSTTKAILDELGLPKTLLGVDVVLDREIIASDVTESILWSLVQDFGGRVKIVVTVIGGQGHIFGRGNQQISARVIRFVGKENIIVVSSPSKLAAFEGKCLLVDTSDSELDAELRGFTEVIVGHGTSTRHAVSD